MSERASGDVLVHDEGPVRVVTLNRPHRRNALTPDAYAVLAAALRESDASDDLRVTVITGADGVFTSGNDLSEFRNPSGEQVSGRDFLVALSTAEKPVIAAVEGFAVGVGVTMLLHCDVAIAGRGTRFRIPFVPLGLSPEAGSSYLLPCVAGTKLASEILLFGEEFSAEHALAAGILSRVVDDGDALAVALERARTLAALPPGAVRASKAMIQAGTREVLQRVIEDELVVFRRQLASGEARAILAASPVGRS